MISLPAAITPGMANPAGEAYRQCLWVFIWFLFNWPLDNIADTLINNTQAFFTLGLRDAVMKSILCQDREFFDFNRALPPPPRRGPVPR